MARDIYHIVACYDIHEPKRLLRVGKIMKNYGDRVLKSVFECNLTMAVFERMKDRVDGVIDHMEDSVRYYFVCDKCLGSVEYSGQGGPFVKDVEVVIA